MGNNFKTAQKNGAAHCAGECTEHTCTYLQWNKRSKTPFVRPSVATPSVLIMGLQTSAHSKKQVRHLWSHKMEQKIEKKRVQERRKKG